MITCLGMILSIVALCITFIVCIAILYNVIFWVDEHIGSAILTVLTIVLCSVITCFSMGPSAMLVENLLILVNIMKLKKLMKMKMECAETCYSEL